MTVLVPSVIKKTEYFHFRTPPYLFAAFSLCDGSSTWYQPWSDILYNVTTTTTSSATATTTSIIASATSTSTTTTTALSNILLNNLLHLDNSQADYHPPPQVCPLHPPLPDFHVILGPLNTTASRVISNFVLIELQREGRTVLTGLIKDNPPFKAPTYQSL